MDATTIPKINYEQGGGIKNAILDHLNKDEVVIVSRLLLDEKQEPLRSLCLSFGTPSSGVDKKLSQNNSAVVSEDDFIHRVTVYDEPLKDPQGNPILSTTAQEFPCHTDEYFRQHPSNVVVMHIVRSSSVGGETILSHIDDILPNMSTEDVEHLERAAYPTPNGRVPILTWENGKTLIRFNGYEIRKQCGPDLQALEPAMRRAVTNLEYWVDRASTKFLLKESECIILRNDRILHGRTAFQDRNRLLLRIRFQLPSS